MMRLLPPFLAFAATIAASTPAFSESPVPADLDAIRRAGNEIRFRVVQRFGRLPVASTIEQVAEDPDFPFGERARKAAFDEEWGQAWALVRNTKVSSQRKARYSFFLGYIARRAEAAQESLPHYEAALAGAKDHVLDERIRAEAIEAAASAGEHARVIEWAATIDEASPEFARASHLLSIALLESGDFARAKRAASSLIDSFPTARGTSATRLTLAAALEGLGDTNAAARAYDDIRDLHPRSVEASTARERLGALEPKLSKSVKASIAVSSPERLLVTYRQLFAAHDSEQVIAGLTPELGRFKKGTRARCEALYLVARSQTKLRKHAKAAPAYERVLSECRGAEIADRFASHSYADDALHYTARILREAKKESRARKVLEQQLARYPQGDMASDAQWLLLRQLIAKKKHEEVIAFVDKTQEPVGDVYASGRLAYFRAKALQQLGRSDEARAAYQQVTRSFPMSYYALLALSRLAADAKTVDACSLVAELCSRTDEPPIRLSRALATNERFRAGTALLGIGLANLARRELARLHGAVPDEDLWAVAAVLDRAGAYPWSHNIPRRQIEGWENEWPQPGTSRRWAIGYPRPFAKPIRAQAKKRGLPPELVWGFMREESGFNPKVKSWAGARGLIQLMPATARTVAKRDGLDPTTVDSFDPNTNIRLGTAYMQGLGSEFGGHPGLIVAGYNAGEANVGRWLPKKGAEDFDLWVEDIPYGQTRKYTKRVLRSYLVYAWLNDRTVPKLPLTVSR
jgi:soluble lytic murein transglycosylase